MKHKITVFVSGLSIWWSCEICNEHYQNPRPFWPREWLEKHGWQFRLFLLLLVFQLACSASAIGQPTQTTAKVADLSAVPAVYEVVPTSMTVGNVVAVEALHVRADHDLTAEAVGYLYSNDFVLEMDCFTEDGITWVKHETGWSVVRNGTAEYIAVVCP